MPLIYYIPRRDATTGEITSVVDTSFNQTSLLISSNLSLQSFNMDASNFVNDITVVGDARASNFIPYFPNWSVYFDGTGDYIHTTTASSAFNYGTGAFTIEFWVYPLSGPASTYNPAFFTNHGDGSWNATNKGIRIHHQNALIGGTTLTFTQAVQNGRWSHVAIVRNGNTVTAYLNGAANGTLSVTASTSLGDDTDRIALSTSDSITTGGREFLTGYISNFRIVKGTAVYTSAFTPSTTPLAAISGTSVLICQDNCFIDESPNAFGITRAGDTKIVPFNPFTTQTVSTPTTYSTYFDGTGDYLTVPATDQFNFGTGAFTVEFWVYPLAYGGTVAGGQLFGTINGSTSGYSINLGESSTRFRIISNATGSWADTLVAGTGPALNTWSHIAVTRSGANISIFVNGTRSATSSSASTWNFSGTTGVIGRFFEGTTTREYNGSISNLRVVKGTAVYDPTQATITVPTNSLSAISSTSLLTCQNATLVDNSTNNFTISSFGQARPLPINPFGTSSSSYSSTYSSALTTPTTYSNYFDGSGDYLSIPYNNNFALNGNFTIEFWLNFSAHSTFGGVVANSTAWQILFNSTTDNLRFEGTGVAFNTTVTLSKNVWNHVALVRDGSTITFYINGVASGTASSSTTFDSVSSPVLIGCERTSALFITGYVSNLRVVKGTAVYTANFTPSTTPLTAISGTSLLTCQNSSFVDNSTNNFTITVNGNTDISRINPFGFTSAGTTALTRGSVYFDGTGDSLTTPTTVGFVFGTGDFTIECWVYLTSRGTTSQIFVDMRSTGIANGIVIYYEYPTNELRASTITSGEGRFSNVSTNTWYHVAATRQSNSFKFFVNGVQHGSTINLTTNYSNNSVRIGSSFDGVSQPMFGYISNLRIVKGTAVYTANFLPPTEPLTAITNTVLLTCQNSNPHNNHTFINSATSTSDLVLTRSGNATQTPISPYSASWGGYFASGQYISTPSSSEFAFGTGDFTVECWLNPLAQTGVNIIQSSASNSWGLITFGSQIYWQQNGGNFGTAAGTVPTNSWSHIAITRSSSTLRRFLNGVLLNSVTDNFNYTGTSGRQIGATGGGVPFWLSNVRIVKGTALYTANFTPSTSPLTAVTGTALLTLQNDQFIDNSSNRFALTLTGTPIPALNNNSLFALNTLPTPTSYSGYFDGTTGYLTGTFNNVGSTQFTLEMWVYKTVSGTVTTIFDGRSTIGSVNGFAIQTDSSNRITFQWDGKTIFTTSNSITINAWNHIAIVRRTVQSNQTMFVYINGTEGVSTLVGANFSETSLTIGNNISRNSFFPGYISNLRIVRGTAVYTANFTPSTTPLTAISGTSLLTCQNSTFIDDSTNNYSIVSTGLVKPTAINPFGSTSATANGYSVTKFKGSAYFDGTTDFLTVSTSLMFNLLGNFTIEAWVYPTALITNSWAIIDARVNGQTAQPWVMGLANSSGYKLELYTGTAWRGTTTIPLNTWTHVAWVRSGSALSSYVNGVRDYHNASWGTSAISPGSTSARIGSKDNTLAGYETQGYISDLRFTNGTALYTSNFLPSSAPLTPTSNTVLMLDGSASSIVDATGKNPIETVGDARISNKAVKYGTTAMYFDGTGDYLLIPSSTDLELGSSNFTIEAWVYPIVGGIIYGKRQSSAVWGGFALSIDPSTRNVWFLADNDTSGPWAVQMTGGTVSLSTWSHIAVTRSGSTWTIWINGTQSTTATSSITVNSSSFSVSVGALSNGDARLTGYISDLRFTKGTARYTTNFTPPTAELPKL